MPITNYAFTQDIGEEGMVATAEHTNIRTAMAPAATFVPYGRVVVQGTAGTNEALLPSATGQTPIGISVFGDIREKSSDPALLNTVPPLNAYNRLTRGTVYMVAETDINPGQAVQYRYAMAGSPLATDGIGRIRVGAVAGQTDPLLNVRVESAAKAGGLVQLAVNFD